MARMGSRGQRWLKGFHILFASMWVGAAVALTLMIVLLQADSGAQRHGMDLAMKLVDDFVIIPAAIGSLLTGLLYSLFTNWGWVKHRWVAVKWFINLFGVLFGTFALGPWLNSLPEMSGVDGLAALARPEYSHARTMLLIFGGFQAATLVFAVFLSTLKPWRRQATAG